ncbi:MAG: cytochrome-c peroxidase [Planctomycetota bacterium]
MKGTRWLVALATSVVVGQEPIVPSSTSDMIAALASLEPEQGWLGTPPGISAEQWRYYRTRYALAPEGNEPDEARIALGQLLFFDKRLSRDRSLSCASCHDPKRGFADGRRTSIGIDGQTVTRNAPTVLNAGLQRRFFWDGRAASLEEQAAGPILNPAEMGMPSRESVVARVREVAEYVGLFDLAYGREPQFEDVARALAAFQRTLVFVDAPFDAFRAGQKDALSKDAQRGFELFAEHCRSCHPVSLREPLLSDGNFHNVGVGFERLDHQALAREAFPKVRAADRGSSVAASANIVPLYGELGRALISKLEYQVGAFRTAPLRNIGLTAPYMHDGSMATLWHVVEHYNLGGTPNTWQDPQIQPLGLTPVEVDQVVAFLFSLTDRRLAEANDNEFARQRRLSQANPVRAIGPNKTAR